MHKETRIDATKAGDEMVFEGRNFFFGRVGEVHMRRDELVVDGVGLQVVFDIARTLVVHAVHVGCQYSRFEVGVQCRGCFELFGHALFFKGADRMAFELQSCSTMIYLVPRLELWGKRPVLSMYTFPLISTV